jgi:16S rRNA (guanine1516-N2)-methyltransferase
LRDAQRRALVDPWSAEPAARIEIVEADARTVMARRADVDAILLDPMYPHSPKSALPAKEMQFFRELTGGDDDAADLLAPALACAASRVAVKRPLRAPPLAGVEPDFTIARGLARFDVYRGRGKMSAPLLP